MDSFFDRFKIWLKNHETDRRTGIVVIGFIAFASDLFSFNGLIVLAGFAAIIEGAAMLITSRMDRRP